jgi:hypothetical protein
MNETELQIRLRRAKEALAYAIDRESEARRALRSAEESRRAAKEKYEALSSKKSKRKSDGARLRTTIARGDALAACESEQ